MRNRIAILLPLVVAGCARGEAHQEPAPIRAEVPGTPPGARLLAGTALDLVSFELDEPAYVAIFAIWPGRAELLYPQRHGEGVAHSAGGHRALTSAMRVGEQVRMRTGGAFLPTTQPVTYLMVASRSPLAVRTLIDNPQRLRRELAWNNRTSSEKRTLEHVLELVIPATLDSDEYSTHVLYGWSSPPTSVGALMVELLPGRLSYGVPGVARPWLPLRA
jgi:hypothetical protein